MAASEKDHLEKAFQEFRDKLHSSIPLRTSFEFHDETTVRKEALLLRKQLLDKFMTKISTNPIGLICELLTELDSRMDELIQDSLNKNREHRKQSEAILGNRMNMLCSDMKTSLETELLSCPDYELESLKESIGRRSSSALKYFEENWINQSGHGNFLEEQKKIFEEKLEETGKEMLEKQECHLEKRSAEETKKLIDDVKTIVLEMSWQIKSFSEDIEDFVPKRVLKKMADELRRYLLGKGGVLKDKHPTTYSHLLEALNDAVKMLDEADETLCRNETIAWAERLDLHLKTHFFNPEVIIDPEVSSTSSYNVMQEVGSSHQEQPLEVPDVHEVDTEDVVLGVKCNLQHNLRECDRDCESIAVESGILFKRPRLSERSADIEHEECQNEHIHDDNEDCIGTNDVTRMENEVETTSENDGNSSMERSKEMDEVQVGSIDLEMSLRQPERSSSTIATQDVNRPLFFKLSSNSISMGTAKDDVFQKLPNWKGELHTLPIVGIDDTNNLTCGPDTLACQIWSLSKFFQGVKTEIKFAKANVTHSLSDEFLFAFLLRSLKEHAEKTIKQSFTSAMIIVPSWLSIIHRFQVKDAAKISGFDQSLLINEEAVAVHAMLKRRSFPENTKFLVLTENFQVLSAQSYDRDRMCPFPYRRIKHIKDRDWVDLNDASMRNEISSLTRAYYLDNYFIIILTESKWNEAYISFMNEIGYDYDISSRPSSSDMFGASELCKLNLSEMATLFVDGERLRIPMKIFSNSIYYGYPYQSSFTMKISRHMDASFRQQNVHDSKENYAVRLDLTTSLQNLKLQFPDLCFDPKEYQFHVTFSITPDAVITIDDVEFRKTIEDGEPFQVKVHDFEFKTGDLSNRQREELCQLMTAIF